MNRYSVIEKLLHTSAFTSWSSQVSLSTIESRVFKNKLADIEIKKPVFITALPRAGTTLLLECCVGTNEFASHTYRDMPFLLIPLLWKRFSRLFKESAPPQERAHGDGIKINADSPEAFEEIIWKGFWPSHYKKDRIIPWSEQRHPEFEQFFKDHLAKIIFVRKNNKLLPVRYISKNNLNIARIKYLKQVFPDALMVVPFRAPLQQASSLLRQHRNFLKIHKEDPFAAKYMEDVGHYDFGNNLRPVDFDNWLTSEQTPGPDTLFFWLSYWVSTYRYLLNHPRDQIHFFSFDLFCEDPGNTLEQFGKLLEITNVDTLVENNDRIILPKPYPENIDGIPRDVLDQAESLYMELQKNCSGGKR